ncbi:hypothetical protein [Kitasatospora sp. NPDC088779]|uniref:hypothetical protein n=1 Tax=Kitasatospora sp. NPDC088779 TaxID=3154964 RepID=UPI00343B0A14
MTNPHQPYFDAVLAALGANADPSESFAEFCADNGEVMLTEICIRLDTDRAQAAGYPHGLTLLWDQVSGWIWARGTSDDRLSNPELLAFGLVVTPDGIATAADLLLSGRADALPIQCETTAPSDNPLTDALAKAVAEGNLDHTTAAQLAQYA